jgi:hypothetical protein
VAGKIIDVPRDMDANRVDNMGAVATATGWVQTMVVDLEMLADAANLIMALVSEAIGN